MNRFAKAPSRASLVFLGLVLIVTLTEIPYVFGDLRLYLLGRFFTAVFAAAAYFVLRKDAFSLLGNILIVISFSIYNISGYLFYPLYLYSYIQCVIALSFLWFTTRRQFQVLSSFMLLTMISVIALTHGDLPYPSDGTNTLDLAVICAIANVVGLLIHHFFTAERSMKEILNDRFVTVGRLAATIIHDLKGGLGTPLMLTSSLRQSLESGNLASAREQVEALERSLSSLGHSVLNLNQLSKVSEVSLHEKSFAASESLEKARTILSKRLHAVRIESRGDCMVRGTEDLLTSVFLNILVNSIDAFRVGRVKQPFMRFEMSERKIVIEDNGPGFPTEVLKRIRRQGFAPATQEGSGLGLFLIREGLASLGGRLQIENRPEGGARIEIHFSSPSLKSRLLKKASVREQTQA